jgi:hypothetical protein
VPCSRWPSHMVSTPFHGNFSLRCFKGQFWLSLPEWIAISPHLTSECFSIMSRGLRYGTPKDAQSDLLFSYVGHDPHCNHEAASSEGSRDLYYLVPLECPHLETSLLYVNKIFFFCLAYRIAMVCGFLAFFEHFLGL